jgi:hypothetical protein
MRKLDELTFQIVGKKYIKHYLRLTNHIYETELPTNQIKYNEKYIFNNSRYIYHQSLIQFQQ